MESRVEDIVIVGAGIAGLSTSLGLHRLGVRSLLLESSDNLRVTGFTLTIWTNAWKALDALGIGHNLRQQHLQLLGDVTTSLITGHQTSSNALSDTIGKHGAHEVHCIRRQLILETLAKELPSGTIRYSSEVVAIEESGFTRLVHLADGTIIKTKVLIGCDGVNSVVAKWLGLNKVVFSEIFTIRGCITLKNGHKLKPVFMQFFGEALRVGVVPCDDKTVYWFFTCTPNEQEKKLEEKNPAKLKQFVLEKLENMQSDIKAFIENTDLDHIILTSPRHRHPWELIFGTMNKSNVCVVGDAFHPMTPDFGQGGCYALEDGVILARCLGEVFGTKSGGDIRNKKGEEEEEEQYNKIEASLKKYADERRWRIVKIAFTVYVAGLILRGKSKFISFFRSFLAPFIAGIPLKIADFDCGKLSSSKME